MFIWTTVWKPGGGVYIRAWTIFWGCALDWGDHRCPCNTGHDAPEVGSNFLFSIPLVCMIVAEDAILAFSPKTHQFYTLRQAKRVIFF